MKLQRRQGASLLTADPHSDNDGGEDRNSNRNKCCCPPAANANESCGRKIPLEILVDHIALFLDRRTYNACLLLCLRARAMLEASWWNTRTTPQRLPPWPRKLASRDPFCRVRCLTFSEDHALLACGCSDGKIRSWDVRIGELPNHCEGHWPDEAVVALAYGHDSSRRHRLLASSSTDGTIRVWRIPSGPPCSSLTASMSADRIQPLTNTTNAIAATKEQTAFTADDNGIIPACALCIRADHAVSLHFSPDDSYLVSGHLRMRTAGDLRPTSTIEIRDVRTGLRLRRLEGGGVPVGFVHVPTVTANKRHRFHGSSSWDNNNDDEDDIASLEEEEHRLISTCGPNTCLKLWSWNRNRCVANDDENENQNSDPRSTHDPIDETMPLHFPANESATGELMGREQYKTVLDGGRCIQQWFLDRFNTVLPIPAAAAARTRYHSNRQSDDSGSGGACVILVAVINEPSKDSFAVWKTSSPRERMVFRNTHPYEIQFSPDGSKIASVDDFNTVKVWRLSDGELLKTFSGGEDDDNRSQNYKSSNSNENRCSHCRIPVGNDNNTTSYDGEEEDSDEISVSYAEEDFSGSDDGGGLFPIHELVFSKDSSTVAVISRCYNEVHLFST